MSKNEKPSLSSVGKILLLFLVYFLGAKLGATINVVNTFAAIVWPPSALALAALLIFGTHLWPGIFLGALVVNLVLGAPLLTATGIAIGNTLEAVVGAYLCTRAPGFDLSLRHIRDVLRLIFRAALLSTLISATIGVSSLWTTGLVSSTDFDVTWFQWWVGDSIAILTLTPLCLVFSSRKSLSAIWDRPIERIALALSVIISSLLVFTDFFGSILTHHLKGPFIFPSLLWAAMRFGIHGAALSTFVTSTIAILATALGAGPFAEFSIRDQLAQLSIFVTVVAMIDLIVAAVVTEREEERHRLRTNKMDLSKALGARDEFLSIASHELKTPLTALKLQLQVAERGLRSDAKKPLTPEKINDVFVMALKQVNSLAALVEELLDLSRIQTGRFPLVLDLFDLSEMVRDVTGRFSAQLLSANSSVQLQLQRNIIGNWDRHRLEQVLVNLISNAMKYAPMSPILISTQKIQNSARLIVEDFGPGIEKGKQAHIFERFERVGQKRPLGGMGLGLFIVKKIVVSHGGEVSVYSEPGKGTRFSIEIPLNPPQSPSL